jgi:hypothetical protein
VVGPSAAVWEVGPFTAHRLADHPVANAVRLADVALAVVLVGMLLVLAAFRFREGRASAMWFLLALGQGFVLAAVTDVLRLGAPIQWWRLPLSTSMLVSASVGLSRALREERSGSGLWEPLPQRARHSAYPTVQSNQKGPPGLS